MRIRQGKTHAPQALSFFYCVPESRRVLLTVTSPAVHFAPIRSGRSRSKKVLSKLFSLFAPAPPPTPPSPSFWRVAEDELGEASSAWWAEMPLMLQSHWRLINTRLKARLEQDPDLELLQYLEGFHTLGQSTSVRSSPIINNYWHATDQRDSNHFDIWDWVFL